jgi:hypothetical protein
MPVEIWQAATRRLRPPGSTETCRLYPGLHGDGDRNADKETDDEHGDDRRYSSAIAGQQSEQRGRLNHCGHRGGHFPRVS